MDSDLRDLVAAMLADAALAQPPPPEAPKRLVALVLLLERWGGRLNLTGHKDARTAARQLLGDAVGLARTLPPGDTLADLGSGAGFPGLPLAILRPTLRVTSIEARERRHHFQREVVRSLDLENVLLLCGRAERLTPAPCDLAVAQAVADLPAAARLLEPWVRPSGWAVIPVGSEPIPPPSLTGFAPGELRGYRRYQEKTNRFVYLAKKVPSRGGC